ncbi:MAG: hypothetical protein LUD47_07595 [Clostridia bacterium]|nr:hypothetical protein [Clostridia bacterium]
MMTIEELKTAIYNITKECFADTNVMWEEEQKAVNPGVNLVTLKLLNVQRSTYFIETYEDDVVQSQPSTANIRIQLFSKGEKRKVNGGTIQVNTAVNDLIDFEHYLTSYYVVEELSEKYDIEIQPGTQVQDITAVLDTAYDYRATQDIVVTFTQHFTGWAGIARKDWKPTASGGGTSELANMQTGYIEDVEITDNIEKQGE